MEIMFVNRYKKTSLRLVGLHTLVSLFGPLFSSPALAASFDCAKAQTHVELLICNSRMLSELDSSLYQIFNDKKNTLTEKESRKLVTEQLIWLKNNRDQCMTEDCLVQAYSDRINELGPFSDKNLTCDEMRRYQNLIFSDGQIDLGSGAVSPIDVDYRCPESVASLPFMIKLLNLAEVIRGEEGLPQICTGSIVHAHWRYYQFSLTEAGFAPLIFLKKAKENQRPEDTPATLNSNTLYSNQLSYFKQWSEENPYNYQMYREFFQEFDKTLPTLSDHYRIKFGLSMHQAKEVARHALMLIVSRAAGSFPEETLRPESPLLQVVRNNHSSQEEMMAALAEAESNGGISGEDVYQALVVALLQNRPTKYVSLLMEGLFHGDIAQFGRGKEPLLSFTAQNRQNLTYLLSKKVPVDAENDFGKTALFYAIGLNEHEAVEILLRNKADVNHTYKSSEQLRSGGDECIYSSLAHTKRTPLMDAAQNSDVRMLKLLIKYGARLNAVDDPGFNALDYAMMGHNGDNEAFLKSLGLEPKNQ